MTETRDPGALLLVVRRDQTDLLRTDAFKRYANIDTVVDRRQGERRVRSDRRVPDLRTRTDRRVRAWVGTALATEGAVLVRR